MLTELVSSALETKSRVPLTHKAVNKILPHTYAAQYKPYASIHLASLLAMQAPPRYGGPRRSSADH